jgi:hypothetical protein
MIRLQAASTLIDGVSLLRQTPLEVRKNFDRVITVRTE